MESISIQARGGGGGGAERVYPGVITGCIFFGWRVDRPITGGGGSLPNPEQHLQMAERAERIILDTERRSRLIGP